VLVASPESQQPLSLHHLTALELTPVELVDLAATLGCSHVGLFTCLPAGMATRFPCIATDAQVAALAERLAATGIGVNNAEVFALRAGVELADYQLSLSRAGQLGARVATVHMHESSPGVACDLLREFCDRAGQQGLRTALEFTSFSAVRTLPCALQLLEAAGHPGACLAIDALHFFRNGGEPTQLQGIPAELIGYLQLCDGPLSPPQDAYQEAVAQRCVPGAGEFALVALLEQLPDGVMVDVEVPNQLARDHGQAAEERAAVAVAAARKIMRQAGWR
jgi:sugar phosphate isomerase/epimerase